MLCPSFGQKRTKGPAHGAVDIRRFALSSLKGKQVQTTLPLGGFGLSRHRMDQKLYELALGAGVEFALGQKVNQLQEIGPKNWLLHSQQGQQYRGAMVLGAQGKRSLVDRQLERGFMQERAGFMAVKCHYEGDFPEDLVALHNFEGGYCGLSRVEDGRINLCYLVAQRQLKRAGSIKELERTVLGQNPYLEQAFREFRPVFSRPLSISNIYFRPKPFFGRARAAHVGRCCGPNLSAFGQWDGHGYRFCGHYASLSASVFRGPTKSS